MPSCRVFSLGVVSYAEALQTQKELVRRRRADEIPDTLLLLEHPPVFTIGRVGKREHLLADESLLRQRGAEVVETDRGGDITYHGPGQIVGYPILDLNALRRDVKWYLERLEQVMIRTLETFGVTAGRIPGLTGAWVGDRKIGAIGVRVQGWVTSHGFALNVDPDLSYYRLIVPCGIRGKGVTSLAAELGRSVPLNEVLPRLVESFGCVLDRRMIFDEEGKPPEKENSRAGGTLPCPAP